MSVIRCDVVAKNKVLFSGELYNVMVPGTEGELGIMENHEPFVSALKDGVIWARTQQEGGEVLSAAIMGGYVQVLKDRVIVICDKTRQIERINVDRLNKDIPVLEEKIANLSETSIVSRSLLTRKLRWCKGSACCKGKGRPVQVRIIHDYLQLVFLICARIERRPYGVAFLCLRGCEVGGNADCSGDCKCRRSGAGDFALIWETGWQD